MTVGKALRRRYRGPVDRDLRTSPASAPEEMDTMSRDDDEETETIEYVEVVATTDRAALLRRADGEEEWFPFSKCDDLDGVEKGDGPGEFACPSWLAETKGW